MNVSAPPEPLAPIYLPNWGRALKIFAHAIILSIIEYLFHPTYSLLEGAHEAGDDQAQSDKHHEKSREEDKYLYICIVNLIQLIQVMKKCAGCSIKFISFIATFQLPMPLSILFALILEIGMPSMGC